MPDARPLRGIIPPMVTPFAEDESLDEAALQREVRWLIEEAGVHVWQWVAAPAKGIRSPRRNCDTALALRWMLLLAASRS